MFFVNKLLDLWSKKIIDLSIFSPELFDVSISYKFFDVSGFFEIGN